MQNILGLLNILNLMLLYSSILKRHCCHSDYQSNTLCINSILFPENYSMHNFHFFYFCRKCMEPTLAWDWNCRDFVRALPVYVYLQCSAGRARCCSTANQICQLQNPVYTCNIYIYIYIYIYTGREVLSVNISKII